jgi:uncharacterized protein YjiS (DUF1127 family)
MPVTHGFYPVRSKGMKAMTARTATWAIDSAQSIFGTELWSSLKRRWTRRRTSVLLADLDDQTLKDIGLDRGQVRRSRQGLTDWVVQTQSGTSRILFIGR